MRTNLFQTIEVKTIPATGMQFELTATPQECELLAERFGLPAVKSFHLTAMIKGHGILEYEGKFNSVITQECVVSLEKFDTSVEGEFKEFFSENGVDFSEETNFDIDMDDEETVDLIKNGRLEIGEIAAQQFGLHLNPFPKKDDVPFEYIEAKATKQNPFSVLKDLLKK